MVSGLFFLPISRNPLKQSVSNFGATAHALHLTGFFRHSKMTAHARLFLRVSSRAVCEWTLEGENEASFSTNFKPSVDGNEFYYLKRQWDFDRDASGVIFRKLQTVSGL